MYEHLKNRRLVSSLPFSECILYELVHFIFHLINNSWDAASMHYSRMPFNWHVGVPLSHTTVFRTHQEMLRNDDHEIEW